MAHSSPSSPFYWNDYYRDTRVLTLPTRAIWMDMLCRVHESPTRGRIRLSIMDWARWCACDIQDIRFAQLELAEHPDVGVIVIEIIENTPPKTARNAESNAFITVVNKRMVREEEVRENNAVRQERFRKKLPRNAQVTADVTPCHTVPSSSSSSSSSLQKGKERVTRAMPEDWTLTNGMIEYAEKKGMTSATMLHEFEHCRTHHVDSRFTIRGWERRTWHTWVLNWISFGSKQVPLASLPAPQAKCAYANSPCEEYAIPQSKYCRLHKELIVQQRARYNEW